MKCGLLIAKVLLRLDVQRKQAEKTRDRGDGLPTTTSKVVRDQEKPRARIRPGLFAYAASAVWFHLDSLRA
jgi:hypothetical protein